MLPFSSSSLDEKLDPKEFAYNTDRVLRGVSVASKPDGWQIVVRCWSKAHGYQYAMWSAMPDLIDGLHQVLTALQSHGGHDLWRKDKFA